MDLITFMKQNNSSAFKQLISSDIVKAKPDLMLQTIRSVSQMRDAQELLQMLVQETDLPQLSQLQFNYLIQALCSKNMTAELTKVLESQALTLIRLDLQTYLRVTLYLHAEIAKIKRVKSILDETGSEEEPLEVLLLRVEDAFRVQPTLSQEDYDFA